MALDIKEKAEALAEGLYPFGAACPGFLGIGAGGKQQEEKDKRRKEKNLFEHKTGIPLLVIVFFTIKNRDGSHYRESGTRCKPFLAISTILYTSEI
ncbi:hypothetical protein [Paenibacillus humicus]|uniref:hypothetical protein n=1 Tax=Paenibacillus humicus TaxID=412861 RepID=UPI001FEC41CE|nr:hypothetical protein [Paenibacillus humicus]